MGGETAAKRRQTGRSRPMNTMREIANEKGRHVGRAAAIWSLAVEEIYASASS
jgi:hypothetical protein